MYSACGSHWKLNEWFGEGWGPKPNRRGFKGKL